jgi:enoyl-CoA hydratase/carnithine racemase
LTEPANPGRITAALFWPQYLILLLVNENHIELHREGPLARLVLNRPRHLNCIDLPMLATLAEQLTHLAADPDLKVLMLSGAGERAFSSGADLKAFGRLSDAEVPHWIELGHAVCSQLARFPRPTLAMVQGYALGGGLELALACDMRIAVGDCWLGFPELQHGWLPGWGGTYRLPALIGPSRASQLIFEGKPVNEATARSWGLVNEALPLSDGETRLQTLVSQYAQVPTETLVQAKAILTTFHRVPSPEEIQRDVKATQAARQ